MGCGASTDETAKEKETQDNQQQEQPATREKEEEAPAADGGADGGGGADNEERQGMADCGKASAAVDALFDDQGTRDLGNGFRAHRVGADSTMLKSVIELLATAEGGTATTAPDPLLDWAYAPRDTDGTSGNGQLFGPLSKEAAEDPKRQEWFNWVATYTSVFATNRNGCYALTAEAPDGNRVVVAAALTAPPGTVPFSTDEAEMEMACGAAGVELAEEITMGNERLNALGEWQEATKIGNADKLGEKGHLKVEVFAVAPAWQGKGCGSALLQFLNDVADADGVPAYLETAGPGNVAFYAKSGYEEVSRSLCGSFTDDGGAVAMLRAGKGN